MIDRIAVDDGPLEVPEFALGHWTHPGGRTGCTVVVANSLVPAAVEVRGCAPGTRETDLLSAGRSVQGVDAVLLTGGSAFGLAAADGVVRWLRENGRGFPTASINVPIVSGAVIFDLAGDRPDMPDSDSGYAAATAVSSNWKSGRFGGGAGASVSKALGRNEAIPSGVGVAQVPTPSGTVSAVFVNNAFGDVVDDRSGIPLTIPAGGDRTSEELLATAQSDGPPGHNTVIGTVVVDQPIDHNGLTMITVAAHSGLARVIRPSHTPADGDTIFALSTGSTARTHRDLMQLTTAAQIVSARAIVNSLGDQEIGREKR